MWLIKRRLKVFTEDTKAWLATMNQNLNPSMAERGDTL
jgi:hypothetical protein